MAETIYELRKRYGVPLVPEEFISEPALCENPRLYFPEIRIPYHLMKPSQADLAERAMRQCQEITGGLLGLEESKYETFEFARPAAVFLEITGVNPIDIFALAQARLGLP